LTTFRGLLDSRVALLERVFPRKALRGDFETSGTVDTVYKDLGLAAALGAEVAAPTLFGALSHQVVGLVRGLGWGSRGFAAKGSLFGEGAGVGVRLKARPTSAAAS
jgi:3-hydroxyisobutyrate dehydrogenase-like beta-hydroxyacid dehydrogenase